MTGPRRWATCSCTPSPTASSCWSNWPSTTAPSRLASAGGQDARRHSVPRGVSRFHHPQRWLTDLPAPDRSRAPLGKASSIALASSGNAELDRTLKLAWSPALMPCWSRAAGVGKSSLALGFAVGVPAREPVAFFVFDENTATLRARGKRWGWTSSPGSTPACCIANLGRPGKTLPGEFRGGHATASKKRGSEPWWCWTACAATCTPCRTAGS